MATTKTVSIKREHEDWLIQSGTGLSVFLQNAIEEDEGFREWKSRLDLYCTR